jgi:hypothetical protein
VQRSHEPQQLPFIRTAGQCAQKGTVAVDCFAAWLRKATARRLAAPRSCSASKSRCSCYSRRTEGQRAHTKAPSPKVSLQPGHRKAAARRLKAPRSCSAPKRRCGCRSSRAAGQKHTKRRHRRKLLFAAWPLEAAERRLAALRSYSVPKKRCSCRSPRAAERCAQKGAVAVGCLEAWLHAAAARRLTAPRSFPGAATAAAHRGRRSDAHPGHRRLLSSLTARGCAKAHSTALMQRT